MTRFIHLTDLHVSHAETDDPTGKPDNPDTLREVVQIINDMPQQPAFVVASGDLTNMGDTASYTLVREILAPLKPPILMALGNHDRRGPFHEIFGNAGSDAPYFHDAVLGGLHVITLDTSIPDHVAGTIDDAQFEYLSHALQRHPECPKVIVMHHPPRLNDATLSWASLDESATQRLAETLAGHAIVGILTGHIHINRVIHWNGIHVVVSTGLDSTIDLLETEDLRILEGSGFGICDWQSSGLAVSFVALKPEAREIAVIDRERLKTFA